MNPFPLGKHLGMLLAWLHFNCIFNLVINNQPTSVFFFSSETSLVFHLKHHLVEMAPLLIKKITTVRTLNTDSSWFGYPLLAHAFKSWDKVSDTVWGGYGRFRRWGLADKSVSLGWALGFYNLTRLWSFVFFECWKCGLSGFCSYSQLPRLPAIMDSLWNRQINFGRGNHNWKMTNRTMHMTELPLSQSWRVPKPELILNSY